MNAQPWHALSDSDWNLLCDLVHDVAAEEAANAINAGDTVDYLFARGYNWGDLQEWLKESNEA